MQTLIPEQVFGFGKKDRFHHGCTSNSASYERSSREANSCVVNERGENPMARQARLVLAGVMALTLACAGCSKKIAVPNVVDQDVDQAKQALSAAGLKPGNITGAQGAGSYVVSQTPAAGAQVSSSSPVDLQIEAPSAVPDLTNNKLTDAVNTLQGLGMKVTFVKQSTMKLFGGPKVMTQSPAPNTPVHRGALITLTVTTPPDLAGLVGMVTKEPAYNKLNPEYRQYLDQFLK
jgi:beta-lactam-binding protein with PASTA domain